MKRVAKALLCVSLFICPTNASYRFDTNGEAAGRDANHPSSELFTACGWARQQVDTNANAVIFIIVDSTLGDSVSMTTSADGTSLIVQDTDAASSTIASLVINQWFGWCVTGDGTGAVGLDGYYILPGQTTFTTQSTGGEALTEADTRIGGLEGAGVVFNGDIFNVKCWDAVLSQAEMLNELFHIRLMRSHNINFWWPLWGIWSTQDFSGNGRPATVFNAVTGSDLPPIG